MHAIAAIGLLTVVLSVLMIVAPGRWSGWILEYERKPYFHGAEVLSRLLLGAVLLLYSRQTLYPEIMQAAGILLLAVAGGLLIVGPTRHRAFAVRSATFTRVFRPAGFVSLGLGLFIVYAAVGPACFSFPDPLSPIPHPLAP